VLLAAPPARVLARLAQCRTYTDLAAGFAVGATAGFRYVRAAANKAFVTICIPPR